jgi:hypothetical protein
VRRRKGRRGVRGEKEKGKVSPDPFSSSPLWEGKVTLKQVGEEGVEKVRIKNLL